MGNHDPQDHLLPLVAKLRDGRRVIVRMVGPDDKDEVEAAFERLCPETRYTRFFTAVRSLPKSIVDSTMHPAPERGVALIALSGEGSDQIMVGGASYVSTPGTDTCEFAVTVADDWHGLGLARRLIETLIGVARARGIRRMEGYVMSTNNSMRGLAARLGFADAPCPGDYTLRALSLRLD